MAPTKIATAARSNAAAPQCCNVVSLPHLYNIYFVGNFGQHKDNYFTCPIFKVFAAQQMLNAKRDVASNPHPKISSRKAFCRGLPVVDADHSSARPCALHQRLARSLQQPGLRRAGAKWALVADGAKRIAGFSSYPQRGCNHGIYPCGTVGLVVVQIRNSRYRFKSGANSEIAF